MYIKNTYDFYLLLDTVRKYVPNILYVRNGERAPLKDRDGYFSLEHVHCAHKTTTTTTTTTQTIQSSYTLRKTNHASITFKRDNVFCKQRR